MPRFGRRKVIELVKHPSHAYMRFTDIPYEIKRKRSNDEVAKLIIGVARGCANLRKSGETFTLAVEVPGTEKDVRKLRRCFRTATKRSAPARLIAGSLYQIDDDKLVGRLTFQTK